MKRYFISLLFFVLPFFVNAELVEKTPIGNGNWLGKFNINGNIVWQVILGTIVTPARASELTLKDQIKNYIKTISQSEGADANFAIQLAGCESGFKPNVYNDHEPRGGVSWGLYQWQVGSWNKYNALFKTNYDRKNWQDQVKMTIQVVKKYGSKDWRNCTRYIKRGDNFLK